MTLPTQYLATMSSTYMPVIYAIIGSQSVQNYYIDNNALVSTAWTTDCNMSSTLASNSTTVCFAAPVLANDALDTSQLTGGTSYNQIAGGYSTQGDLYSNTSVVLKTEVGQETTIQTNLNAANFVTADAWLSNQSAQAGQMGFAAGGWLSSSPFQNLWSINLGSVTANQVELYIGVGDYSTIFTGDASNSVALTNVNQTYEFSGAWFGLNSTGSYFSGLGYSLSPTVATIAFNFQGIGLPQYEWVQLINLMGKVSKTIANDLSCNTTICTLPATCSSPSYKNLFDYIIMVQFGAGTNYVSVNLGSLIANNPQTGFCDIYIQQTSQVILGSMWLQNFVAYFNGTLLQLQVSQTAQAALISSAGPVNTIPTPFTYVSLPVVLSVNISGDSGMLATIQADLGLQGNSSFLFSMISNQVSTYDQNCQYNSSNGQFVNCNDRPNYATPYWNDTQGTAMSSTSIIVDGFEYDANMYNQTLCLEPQTAPLTGYFCTAGNTPFYGVYGISENYWNYMSPAFAGVLGFGQGSPIWTLIDPLIASKGYYYEVVLAGAAGSSSISLNTGTIPTVTVPAITVTPLNTTNQNYALTEIAFGVADLTTSMMSYMSVMLDVANNLTYVNSAVISADMRGIALPEFSFYKFVNLLSIATEGAVSCAAYSGGFCVLPGMCSDYQQLYDYSFYIQLAGDSNYMLLPLESVIATVVTQLTTTCNIYVQYLDSNAVNGNQVVLGVGFLQSFSFMQANSNSTTLTVNPNAGISPYLGNQTMTMASTSIFQVQPIQAEVLETMNEYPAIVQTSVQGVTGNSYFMIDFTNDQTVVWDKTCIVMMGSGNNCDSAPTYLNNNYYNLSPQVKNYTDKAFGGYLTSGYVQITKVNPCLSLNSTCTSTLTDVFVATEINADAWFYNVQNIAVGNLGYGPFSQFWYQFTDPMTNTATFSVALNNNGTANNSITLGAGSTVGFQSATSLNIRSQFDFSTYEATYDLMQIGFGRVYQTNGVDTSSYFEILSELGGNVVFTLNFAGLGLPTALFNSYSTLIYNATDFTATCDDVCTFPGQCSQYSLEAFSFQMTFAGPANYMNSSNYMNVPLSAFQAYNATTDTCSIYVQKLVTGKTQSDNIILGSMFFRNFYGIFNNTYIANNNSAPMEMNQTLELYVNVVNTSAYIGNEILPQGINPFLPAVIPVYALIIDSDSLYDSNIVTVQASLGSLSTTTFYVSLTGSTIAAVSQDCSFSPTQTNCTGFPVYATNYYIGSLGTGSSGSYDGYYGTGSLVTDDSVCLEASLNGAPVTKYCHQSDFIAISTIASDNWNFDQKGTAGIIGISRNFGLWSLFGINVTDSLYCSVQFQNTTNWQWKESITASSLPSTIQFSGSPILPINQPSLVVTAIAYNNSYSLNEFSFGIANLTAQTISAQSILNSDEALYGNNTNTTVITLDFVGIGLPTQSYNIFTNLLSIATNGSANCPKTLGGMCEIPQACDSLTSLWEYSFYIGFGSDSYITVPLASFAINQKMEGSGTPFCLIFVQPLNNTLAESQQIVLGQMFFQSFFAEFNQSQTALTQMTLQVGPYALSGTQLLTQALIQTTTPFVVQPTTLQVTTQQSLIPVEDQFPTVVATVTGMIAPQGTYLLDFSNDKTVFWAESCQQNITGTNLSCSNTPTYLFLMYNPTKQIRVFQDMAYSNVAFAGYLTSGVIQYANVCLNTCRTMLVYAATYITEDNWIINNPESGQLTNGIFGLGPNSALWNQFVDPTTGLAQYSISLSKTNSTLSTITLGSSGLSVSNSAAMTITTDSTATYGLDTFGFGTVYFDTNGVATSSYFQNITTAPVEFSVNYQGLGLPQVIYNEWTVLLQNLTNQSCTVSNGVCMLPGDCSTYSNFTNFTFQMLFTGASNYIQVPLSAFVRQATNQCSLYVYSLQASQVQASNIILGFMFFQEFEATFSNQYSQSTGLMTTQTGTVTLQPTAPSIAYIGNQQLAMGVNPFYTAPPTPPTPVPTRSPSVGAIIILIIVAILLIILVVYNVFKYCVKPSDSEQAASLVYERNSERQPMNVAVSLNKYDEDEL